MQKKHIFFGFISFFVKRIYYNIKQYTKNFKLNINKKKKRVMHIANYIFTKDGFLFYRKKFVFNLKFLKYRFTYLIKSFFKNSKTLLHTGYLSFTIIFYIVLSVFFFFLTYNLWVQSYDTVKVPDFKQMKFLDAIEQIQDLKLIPYIDTRYSNLPYGTIISQYPLAGHVIKQNRKVRLIISKGLENSYLDDFTGWTMYALEKKIHELSNILKREIKIEIISEEYSDLFDKGTIISQLPQAGTDLDQLFKIQIVISKGPIPESFVLPDFVGNNIEDVQKIIESMGLILNIQYREVQNLDKVGIVLEQIPKANEKINKGSVITLIVGQKKL
ncbi:MAG: PASTA domain-containing protein [Exilispira sp.]